MRIYRTVKFKVSQAVYNVLILPLLILTLKIAAKKNKKVRETLTGQKGVWERVRNQAKRKDNNKAVIWFHVASAGEFLQALPVMERLMKEGFQCALTITSISGYRWAIKKRSLYPNIYLIDYLPFDTKANMRRMLSLINPKVLVFVKFDLWPNLIWEANKLKIPQVLISATLQKKSKRTTSIVGRAFYATLYSCLNQILTVTEQDKRRFVASCPLHQRIEITGDTRFDSVLDRKANLRTPNIPIDIANKKVLLLGSMWPADEEHIFPPLLHIMQQHPELTIIYAPHEIDDAHINRVTSRFNPYSPRLFSSSELEIKRQSRFLIVNTVGVLSALYRHADIAYVGGAFSTGVHNTMEPAAMNIPVVFGPFYQNSPEAIQMANDELSFSIKNAKEFHAILTRLITDDIYREETGRKAAAFIDHRAGAADICFNKIKDLS